MKKRIISIVLAIGVLASGMCFFTGCSKKAEPTFEVKAISELATLRCYYHNVGELRKDAKKWNKFLGKHGYGYKKAWIEYTGIVTCGIDVNKVTIDGPDDNNVVTITIPEAEIQSIDLDEDTMSDPYTESGILTKVTTEEKTELVAAEQEKMKETAEADENLKNRAEEHAKKILENYVINVGNSIGQTYTVEFKNAE